jgi:hypothetical protein
MPEFEDILRTHAELQRQNADTFNEVLREFARAKIQKEHIHNYNGANLAYTHGADMANKLGLSEGQKLGVQPFPSSQSVMQVFGPGGSPQAPAQPAQQTPQPRTDWSADHPPPERDEPYPRRSDPKASPWYKQWWAPALAAMLGAGTVAAVPPVIDYWSASPEQPPVVDPHFDANVGLEVEGF